MDTSENYIKDLVRELQRQNYSLDYIKLCKRYCVRLLDNKMPVIFDQVHFSKLIGIKQIYLAKLISVPYLFYKEAKIPKKYEEKYRSILVPFENLKYVQRWILNNVLYNISIHNSATGFIPNKSIIDNAKPHVNKECVINLDIKDFFTSIPSNKVFGVFKYMGYTDEVSYVLTNLCTYNDYLPQGAPTSPYLSNIIFKKLDKRFYELSKKLEANYTRYADDITISGSNGISNWIGFFKKIIMDEGFIINEEKTRVQYSNERQIVTGLIVNEKISVPRKTKRYLKQQIYYCNKYGVYNHMKYIGIENSNFKEYLYGLALFIKMVEKQVGVNFLEELNDIDWGY